MYVFCIFYIDKKQISTVLLLHIKKNEVFMAITNLYFIWDVFIHVGH